MRERGVKKVNLHILGSRIYRREREREREREIDLVQTIVDVALGHVC